MPITIESLQTQIPYYLTKEAKEGLTKALSDFPCNINYYIERYQEEILQGDGWTSLEIIGFESGERKAIKGIILSNSCDISSENMRDLPIKITFAPIVRLNLYVELLEKSGLNQQNISGKIDAIKEQKVTSLFYLPKGARLDEDYIALLDDLYTVPFTAFQKRTNRVKLFTLSQVGFYLFLFKLSIHFCRFHENIPRSEAGII